MGKRYLILGNGIAGLTAAETIRGRDAEAEITMVSEEKEPAYLRPLLSKTWFKAFQKEHIRIRPESWYQENRIEVLSGRKVIRLMPEEHRVILNDGEELSYDICVYAMGARCFVPPIEGSDKKGVMTVRTVEDFDRIRRRLLKTKRAVVIGGGVIGLEMAWELKQMGCETTILESAPWLMGRLLDQESAGLLTDQIRAQGIACHAGVQIRSILGDEQVRAVSLADGREFPAELVLISTGIRANIQVAAEGGIACDRGVLVDNQMKTGAEDVYAAGDCIQWKSPNPGLWGYAKTTGEVAGINASSQDGSEIGFVPRPEFVVLSTMGTGLFSAGDVSEGAGVETVTQKREAASEKTCRFVVNSHEVGAVLYKKKFYRQGKLTGAVLMGDLSEMEAIKSEMGVRE